MSHNPLKKELVLKTKIKKEPGWVYFVDKNGNLRRGRIGAIPNHYTELVAELNIKREKGISKIVFNEKPASVSGFLIEE